MVSIGGDTHDTHRKASMGTMPPMQGKDAHHGGKGDGDPKLSPLLPEMQAGNACGYHFDEIDPEPDAIDAERGRACPLPATGSFHIYAADG